MLAGLIDVSLVSASWAWLLYHLPWFGHDFNSMWCSSAEGIIALEIRGEAAVFSRGFAIVVVPLSIGHSRHCALLFTGICEAWTARPFVRQARRGFKQCTI